MKIIIIGSGLIGVSTAYFLRRYGHDVAVLDRQTSAGQETSFANGALLTPSMAEPWNSPGSWRVLMASLGRKDAPMQLRMRALPSLARWGVSFLRNSNANRYEVNAHRNLCLALYSLRAMEIVRQQVPIEYGRSARGTLRIFRDPRALDCALAWATRPSAQGLKCRALSSDATVALEPALAPIAGSLAGGIHYPGDESGDAYKFCVALAEHARHQGVQFRYGTAVSSLEVRAGRLIGVMHGRECLTADRYVVAAGSYSTALLRSVGIHLPVQPVKGYSITFDIREQRESLCTPIVDDDLHAAVVPLSGAIRVAGTAEFAGFNRTLNSDRVRNLANLVRRVLPQAPLDPTVARPWCGLRPTSADGVPIIGPTPIENLLINTGHGHLGWTMAAGSGQLLADLMSGEPVSIDPASYALERF
jgi:D-amino-acid dehydrogenase